MHKILSHNETGGKGISRFWQNELGISKDENEQIRNLARGIQEEISTDLFGENQDVLQEGNYNTDEVIEACKSDLNFLASITAPELFQFMFPPVFLAIWKLMVDAAREKLVDPVTEFVKKFPQLAIGIPRSHAKTTLIKFFVIFCILFTNKKFILVISSTANLAENVLSDIKDMLDEPNIKRLFGDWRLGCETDRNDLKKFGFRGRNIILAAIGAEGSLRGLNIKNARPDLMIFEDLQTRECADSQLQSETLEKWMIGTAMKAKSPAGCLFLFIGNMYPTPNSILRKLKNNHTWIKFISGAILADGSALWEELRSLSDLLEELDSDIAAGHPEIFFSEVLNDTNAGTNTSVDFSRFAAWPYREEDLPQGKFILIDPSTGAHLDHDCLGYFEIYDETPCFRSLVQGHFSPGVLIKKALILALSTGTKLIVCEATAYQFTLLYWFEQVCTSLGIEGLIFMPIYQTQTSKNSRISKGLLSLTSGEIILHPNVVSLVQEQISNWKPMKRDNVDDILDLISNCKKVLVDYGAEAQTDTSTASLQSLVQGVVENNHAF